MDAEVARDYHILKNYLKHGMDVRWLLSITSRDLLNFVDSQKEWNPGRKLRAKCFIQTDLISKIMMYAEDIAAFSLSFLENISLQQLLDESEISLTHVKCDEKREIVKGNLQVEDLGKRIGNFYGMVDNLSDEQLYKLFNYVPFSEITFIDDELKVTIKKVIDSNFLESRRILKDLQIFGITHHPFYKRFKHAGVPIVYNLGSMYTYPPRKDFETYSKITLNKKDSSIGYVIPFSGAVLESYNYLMKDIEMLLTEMITNRIDSLERDIVGTLPSSVLNKSSITRDEEESLVKARSTLNEKYPSYHANDQLHFFAKADLDRFKWYTNLDKYISDHQKRTS